MNAPASRPRRSVMYVPAINQKAMAKVKTLDADAIVFDLEDAVAPAMKTILHSISTWAAGGAETVDLGQDVAEDVGKRENDDAGGQGDAQAPEARGDQLRLAQRAAAPERGEHDGRLEAEDLRDQRRDLRRIGAQQRRHHLLELGVEAGVHEEREDLGLHRAEPQRLGEHGRVAEQEAVAPHRPRLEQAELAVGRFGLRRGRRRRRGGRRSAAAAAGRADAI